ncbi:MAG: DUF6171 family protein [Treponema sp.]|nr:DUF6171 family protein [Treponema sp.]
MQKGSHAECFRCGDQDLSPEAVANLAARLPLDAALRAGAVEYQRRLAVCEVCEALRNGILCAHCGCFVLFRARILAAYCPHPGGDRWAGNGVKINA